LADFTRRGTNHDRKAEIERIAEKDPAERRSDDRSDAEELQRLGSLFTRGAHAEISAANHDVARTNLPGEFGRDRLKTMSCEFGDRQLHVFSGREHVGIDVVTKHEGAPAHDTPAERYARGSAMRPSIADAATV